MFAKCTFDYLDQLTALQMHQFCLSINLDRSTCVLQEHSTNETYIPYLFSYYYVGVQSTSHSPVSFLLICNSQVIMMLFNFNKFSCVLIGSMVLHRVPATSFSIFCILPSLYREFTLRQPTPEDNNCKYIEGSASYIPVVCSL